MGQFAIDSFIAELKQGIYDKMPYENDTIKHKKHKKRPLHIRDVALKNNQIINVGVDGKYFEIGNDYSETDYPYYHILEDAEVIYKRNRSTKVSRGSSGEKVKVGGSKGRGHKSKYYDKVPLSCRDYGKWTVKMQPKTGKVQIYQEYRKNVRGKRSKIGSSTQAIYDYNGNKYYINREADYYKNIHYHYIENILETNLLDQLASEFGLKRKRTQIDELYEVRQEAFDKVSNDEYDFPTFD